MQTHDSTGRRYPNHAIPLGITLHKPDKARTALLKAFQDFGPFGADHCRAILHVNGLRDLSKQNEALKNMTNEQVAHKNHHLRNGRATYTYLIRPSWQFPSIGTAWPKRNARLWYDIGNAGYDFLKAQNPELADRINDKHRYHFLMRSTCMAEIMVEVQKRRDWTFIPSSRIPYPNVYTLPIKIDGATYEKDLTPDDRFIIDYGGSQRMVFLEVDRGTETVEEVLKYKKTIERMIRQYQALIRREDGKPPRYHDLLKFYSTAFVLIITTSEKRKKHIEDVILKCTNGKGCNYMGVLCDKRFAMTEDEKTYPAPTYNGEWFNTPFMVPGKGLFCLAEPDGFLQA